MAQVRILDTPFALASSIVSRIPVFCMCHGVAGQGNGPIAPFLVKFKPANLASTVAQSKSDGSIFLTISNGVDGRMPALNENLTVSERWDVVNFIRTLKLKE